MTCHSDRYKEVQPKGWPSLTREEMPNKAWESLRGFSLRGKPCGKTARHSDDGGKTARHSDDGRKTARHSDDGGKTARHSDDGGR